MILWCATKQFLQIFAKRLPFHPQIPVKRKRADSEAGFRVVVEGMAFGRDPVHVGKRRMLSGQL